MEANLNMISIHTKSLESFATSMTNMDKKTMDKMMCNIANWALLYAPRDENYDKICENYQCDCTDPEKYNFEDEGRFLILNHHLRTLVKNGMSNESIA